MKLISAQSALQGLYFLLFFVSFGLWYYFQNYSDFHVISLQWYPAVCTKLNATKKVVCYPSASSPKFWVIQGFRAFKSTGPRTYCDNRYPYIDNYIKSDNDLYKKLQLYWVSILNGTEPDIIWKHEYTKYGTCVETSRRLGAEAIYFHKSMDLFKTINLKKILDDNEIVPSETPYLLSKIKKSVEEKIKSSVQLLCFPSKNKSQQVLAQINVCVDSKSLKIKSCASSVLENVVEDRKWDDKFEDLDQLYQQMHICSNKLNVLYLTNHRTVSRLV